MSSTAANKGAGRICLISSGYKGGKAMVDGCLHYTLPMAFSGHLACHHREKILGSIQQYEGPSPNAGIFFPSGTFNG